MTVRARNDVRPPHFGALSWSRRYGAPIVKPVTSYPSTEHQAEPGPWALLLLVRSSCVLLVDTRRVCTSILS